MCVAWVCDFNAVLIRWQQFINIREKKKEGKKGYFFSNWIMPIHVKGSASALLCSHMSVCVCERGGRERMGECFCPCVKFHGLVSASQRRVLLLWVHVVKITFFFFTFSASLFLLPWVVVFGVSVSKRWLNERLSHSLFKNRHYSTRRDRFFFF